MSAKLVIIILYLGAVVAVGLTARRGRLKGPVDFFLAGRTFGPVVLVATMAATNFSAFTVVGFAGAGYRLGFAFYPIMGFGTAFMALSFLLVGLPIWRLGKRYGLVTPPELLSTRFDSRPLGVVFGVAMAVFTLPYLAIQPLAAGYALESTLGVPHAAGAALVTALVVTYCLVGGVRSVAWTDVLQGVLMFAALTLSLFAVARASGGMETGLTELFERSPEHFMRPGAGGGMALGIWGSYMLLWLLADPMFPQLFQRFYAARNERALVRTAVAYPFITTVLFFLPVAIGVLGRLHVSGLEGSETDRILPMVVERFGGDWLAGLVSAGLVAAIMSTMDSQLLTLGSIVERDLLGIRRRGVGHGPDGDEPRRRARLLPTRLSLAGLAIVGYLLSLRPPATILGIATEAFSGLAVLLPAVVAALWWKRATAAGAIASIVAGESWVALSHFGLVPDTGLLPALPAVAVAAVVLILGSVVSRPRTGAGAEWMGLASLGLPRRETCLWALLFAGVLAASIDWWRFGEVPSLVLGLPSWLAHFAGLALLLAVAFDTLGRRLLARSA
ncbi:MAG: sodium:solute symporter family protein [Candidatus Eisenbacteria bacterium]|nr:sodium:solute symporter family protein [Candidatus Eisenbacteria bacterium]